MNLVDTHTHLYDRVFDTDREEVISRAGSKGICAIISVSENLNDAQKNLVLANQYKEIQPAAGLYPTILDMKRADEMISYIRLHRHELVAIGEVGLCLPTAYLFLSSSRGPQTWA